MEALAVANGSVGELPPESVIFGQTAAMQEVREKLRRVSAANVPVLIYGESGTGKEIIARLAHALSPWNAGPFVKVNCPAIPGSLLESELFGYEKGAFTGAYGAKPGRVEMAHRGTLFLDEIAELEAGLQAKLLQLLQDGQFCRIGAQEDKKVEVRVVCATNRVLADEVRSGSFRQDLFYRINVVSIEMPPLRERQADIPLLADFFLRSYNLKFGCTVRPLSAPVVLLLQRYSWPGNIRQLENLLKRYVVLGSEEAIRSEIENAQEGEIDMELAGDGSISLKKITRNAMRGLERRIILKTLQAHQWNRKRAARALNISYRALLYKLKEAGVQQRRTRLEDAEDQG